MSNATLPPDCYSHVPKIRNACLAHCNVDICPLDASYWDYLPSLAANGLFTALFTISLVAFSVQAALYRKYIGFSVAMISGSVLEVLGYAARVWSHEEPFSENPFLIQIITLTIAPAFYAAGIYFCLSRIVTTFGASNSRIAPKTYPRLFIGCDILSLLLQATGGGMASVASHNGNDPSNGNHIMIAGLAFQVLTLFIFMLLAADFAWTTWKRIKALGTTEALDQTHTKLRNSFKFRGFLYALTFATLCIFTRSVYRVAELSEGWEGQLIKTQKYFIGLEGAIVAAGVLALNAFHPGFCFREEQHDNSSTSETVTPELKD